MSKISRNKKEEHHNLKSRNYTPCVLCRMYISFACLSLILRINIKCGCLKCDKKKIGRAKHIFAAFPFFSYHTLHIQHQVFCNFYIQYKQQFHALFLMKNLNKNFLGMSVPKKMLSYRKSSNIKCPQNIVAPNFSLS